MRQTWRKWINHRNVLKRYYPPPPNDPFRAYPKFTRKTTTTTTKRAQPPLSPGQTDSQVNSSLQLWPPTCVELHRLETICVDLRWFWSSSNSWPPNASQHKLIASQLYTREIYEFLRFARTWEPTCESVWPPIASPYASSGFANLRVRFWECTSVIFNYTMSN